MKVIYRSLLYNFHRIIGRSLQMNKKAVIVYASKHHGNTYKLVKEFIKSIKEIVLEKDAMILGAFGCKGYNTYGPWKIIGGMNKKHPTKEEVASAIEFFEKIQI